jgi:hypothetical protein
VVKDQEKLGWDQWLKGQISIKWGEMVKYDFENKKAPKEGMSAEKWGKDIIAKTWQFMLECWLTRKKFERNNEKNSIKIERKTNRTHHMGGNKYPH